MRNPYRVPCYTLTLHSSPSTPRDSAPRLWGRGPSPTFPHPSQFAAGLFFSLPVSCLQSRFSVRPRSLPSPRLAVLPLAPPSPILCFCQRPEPQQGAAGCWETLSFRFVFPCGVPSDPLWNIFLLAQSLGFHLTTRISSSYPSHPWPNLTLLQHLPISFSSLYPFPSI